MDVLQRVGELELGGRAFDQSRGRQPAIVGELVAVAADAEMLVFERVVELVRDRDLGGGAVLAQRVADQEELLALRVIEARNLLGDPCADVGEALLDPTIPSIL